MGKLWESPSVVVLTGASAAIGAETARQLAAVLPPHSRLILTSRSAARLAGLQLQPKAADVTLQLEELDLRRPDKETFAALLAKADGAYHNAIIIHNAAALGLHLSAGRDVG